MTYACLFGRRRGVRPATGVAILVLTLAWLAGVSEPARAATGPNWLEAQRIEPGQGSISGLSCPTVTTCVAASASPIVQDDGPSFEPASDPDPLSEENAVSCAPRTDFCMFVDVNGGAFTYDNGSFGTLTNMDANNELDSVSCPASGFCMAIDHNNTVFKYSGGAWDNGTPLDLGGHSFSNFVNVSCASTTFCIALAATSDGELYYTWNGTSWSGPSSPFDTAGGYTVSLSCTSTTFCVETDEAGNASVFSGSGWSTPQNVDNTTATPRLYSSCVGTSCVGLDFNDNFVATSDGSTWSSPVNIHASTLISGIESLACASATLCVAGDGLGNATTYAIPPAPTTPTLTGTGTVGQTLTLTHASVQNPPVWYDDQWFRCDNPDTTCANDPISTSTSGYTLVAADAGEYIDARETVGFGFDEEGFLAGDHLVSNIVGPITTASGPPPPPPPTPGRIKFTGSVSTSKAGVVTISLSCTGGRCTGTVKLTSGKTIGSAGYTLAAGQTVKITVKLTSAGKKLLKKHKGRLSVKLVITPSNGAPTTITIKLKAKH
jgi:hypothetical protein